MVNAAVAAITIDARRPVGAAVARSENDRRLGRPDVNFLLEMSAERLKEGAVARFGRVLANHSRCHSCGRSMMTMPLTRPDRHE